MVRAINVRDGQAVQAGEVLLTLDATTRDAEVQRLGGDRLAARLDLARASSMLLAIQGNREPAPVEQWLADVGAGQQAAARHWVAGQYQEYRTVLDALEAEIRQRDAEILAAKGQIDSLDQELTKARYEQSLTELRAPVAGTVQQLAVHTLGGVVTPAQPLLTLVPSDQHVEVEALLENKDVGFVHAGQPVSVKVETFNFTKYGRVAGEVVSVSQDAIKDEKRGQVYNAKVRLARSQLLIDGRSVALAPGMAVTVEIKTDQRRVIDYFLSPLEQHLQESLGER
ncbi:hemolysin secretion protein D [Pseudomonas veronii 1YdBTEX2]|uniref:Membrane fusion protein (MFP) family protein n=2 Tax=Pseudomonas veronii TaxID=76761 RepID=A0A7Y1F6P8_PSEVE|nr:HlyD family type I secretion periplasmic adaptor subunit [Pseudomonas veronii]SBW82644.1 hemolysin secretion protein D [Pseudomonas veronii 1YdBTEX2]